MHQDIIEKFTSLLLSRVEKFRCGSGQDPTVTHGPVVNKAAVDKVHQHVEDALTKGGKLVYGGKPLNVNGKGFFYEPKITNCTKDMMGFNTHKISAAETRFGGIKESGVGREGSLHGIAEYMVIKVSPLAESSTIAYLT